MNGVAETIFTCITGRLSSDLTCKSTSNLNRFNIGAELQYRAHSVDKSGAAVEESNLVILIYYNPFKMNMEVVSLLEGTLQTKLTVQVDLEYWLVRPPLQGSGMMWEVLLLSACYVTFIITGTATYILLHSL